jgi:RHS repeat-associated protein
MAACGSTRPKYQYTFKEKEDPAGGGLYDYGARLYNPRTGRFLSADRMTADGYNRYAYVQNRPLVATDPTGHSFEIAGGSDGMPAIDLTDCTGGRCAPAPSLQQIDFSIALEDANPIPGKGLRLARSLSQGSGGGVAPPPWSGISETIETLGHLGESIRNGDKWGIGASVLALALSANRGNPAARDAQKLAHFGLEAPVADDLRRLSPKERHQFFQSVKKLVESIKSGEPPPKGLAIHEHKHSGLLELNWGDGGRALFTRTDKPGIAKIQWYRIGRHDILNQMDRR